MNKKKKSVWHLITIIVSIASIILNGFMLVGLLTNILGIKDVYIQVLQKTATYAIDVDSEISFACFDTSLTIITHVVFAILLVKLYVKATPSVELSRKVNIGFWYLFLTFSVASVLTLVAGYSMVKKVSKPIIAEAVPREPEKTPEVNAYKMKGMSEAVARLKELRKSGAISDEEYYASLDKILEG